MRKRSRELMFCSLTIAFFSFEPRVAFAATQVPAGQSSKEQAAVLDVGSPSKKFDSAVEGFSKILDEAVAEMAAAEKAVKDVQVDSPADVKVKTEQLRNSLMKIGEGLQPDSPLARTVGHFQTWASAQQQRVESKKAQYGEAFVNELKDRYEKMQARAAEAKSAMDDTKKLVDQTLSDLASAGEKVDELVLVEDADKAINTLVDAVGKAKQAVEQIRKEFSPLLVSAPST